jgi:hypothetical protein
MKWLWTSLAVAVFSTIATGQQIKLSGKLITDAGEPVPNTKVRVEGESARTDVTGASASSAFEIARGCKGNGHR